MVTKFVMPCAKLKCGTHCLKIIGNVNDDSLNQMQSASAEPYATKQSIVHMHVYIHICVHMYICECVCVCVFMSVQRLTHPQPREEGQVLL